MPQNATTAWHFTCKKLLRDGRPIPAPGVTLRHEGDLVMGVSGYHASRRLIDALVHAPGTMLHLVECGGVGGERRLFGADRIVCRERTVIKSLNATRLLRLHARQCALDVIHLWDAPDVVREHLTTGHEGTRRIAYEAALESLREAIAARRGTWECAAWAAMAGTAWASMTSTALPISVTEAAQEAAQYAALASHDVLGATRKQNDRLTRAALAAMDISDADISDAGDIVWSHH